MQKQHNKAPQRYEDEDIEPSLVPISDRMDNDLLVVRRRRMA
jgi:hypothetical protein